MGICAGGAFAGISVSRTIAAPQETKAGGIPFTDFGKTGIKVSVIAQGGARMDLDPDVPIAAAQGIGLKGSRKNVFLTTKSAQRTAQRGQQDLETSLRLL